MANPENAIFYLEFPATSLPAVKDFYRTVFGWTFTDYGPAYTAFEDGHLQGGFALGEPVAGGGPLAVIFNKDLEAARERVVRGGGVIVKEIFGFPGGRRFHFADPSGNVLAVCTDVE